MVILSTLAVGAEDYIVDLAINNTGDSAYVPKLFVTIPDEVTKNAVLNATGKVSKPGLGTPNPHRKGWREGGRKESGWMDGRREGRREGCMYGLEGWMYGGKDRKEGGRWMDGWINGGRGDEWMVMLVSPDCISLPLLVAGVQLVQHTMSNSHFVVIVVIVVDVEERSVD